MSKVVHYFADNKNVHHGEAILAGWGAERVWVGKARLARGAGLHLIGGLQFGALEILMEARETKAPYIFFDRAYFGGGPGTNRLRAVRGAYQKNWVDDFGHNLRPQRRLDALGVRLEPWRAQGRHILVVPPGAAICRLFGLGDWEAKTLRRLKDCTERPVVVSYKGDQKPLADRLAGCHAVVTWTSNVAVEAVCAGVPAFVGPESAAAPVATQVEYVERLIEEPLMPDDQAREAWAASLAFGQFSVEEIRSGVAREALSTGGD